VYLCGSTQQQTGAPLGQERFRRIDSQQLLCLSRADPAVLHESFNVRSWYAQSSHFNFCNHAALLYMGNLYLLAPPAGYYQLQKQSWVTLTQQASPLLR